MHPLRRQRLITLIVIFLAISLSAILVVKGLSKNLNLFYTPTDLINAKDIEGKKIRAGGMVIKGSILKSLDSLQVEFKVTDFQNSLTVKYEGVLPDLFSEEAGVVVQGSLDEEGVLHAQEVLAKHDENYMPPEVAKTLKKDDS
ncbi:MAG: cytochrome c maturation protein CcmE [Gammaproteobacteria bacterium]